MRQMPLPGALLRAILTCMGCWVATATALAEHTELLVDSSDSGQAPGTLGWAIDQANQAPTDELVVIRFDPVLDGEVIALGNEPLPPIERRQFHLDARNLTNIVLDGEQLTRVLTIDAPPSGTSEDLIDIRVVNIEFRNGHATDSGGCLRVFLAGSGPLNDPALVIESSRFVDCHVDSEETAAGGGMFFEGTISNNVRITDSAFIGNTVHTDNEQAFVNGGGLALDSHRLLEIKRTRFIDNTASGGWGGRGGGLHTGRPSRVELVDLDFRGNSADRGGGAYIGFTLGREYWLENIAASNNFANVGAAFKFWGTGSGGILDTRVWLRNGIIADNHASHSGAITMVGTGTIIGNTIWHGNTADVGPADLVIDSGVDARAVIRVHNSAFSSGTTPGCGSTDEEPDFHVESAGNNYSVDASCEFLEAEIHDTLVLTTGDHPVRGARLVYPAANESPLVGGGNPEPPDGYPHTCHPSDFLRQARPLNGDGTICTAGAIEWPFEVPLFNDCFDQRGCSRWW
jgi:hypothetical protein